MRYLLSKIIPVPMRSTYGVELAGESYPELCLWWQWRGHVWAIDRYRLASPA